MKVSITVADVSARADAYPNAEHQYGFQIPRLLP
jgi:hypothetical protein